MQYCKFVTNSAWNYRQETIDTDLNIDIIFIITQLRHFKTKLL